MDNDGHTGIDNQQLKHGASGNFNLILSGLKHGNGRFDFVIHVSPNVSYDVGIKPDKFLEDIGFLHYAGQCPFYQERCFYRIISTVTPNSLLYRDMNYFHQMQSQFVSFAEKIGEIYPLQKDQDRILKEIGSQARKITIFVQPLKIDTSLDSIPSWIETVKFSKLKNLEAQKNSFQIEIDNLSKYLPLLYGTGTALEDAVIEALVLLGLKAERTEKGFTADILAQTLDGSKKFGIEVTGTSGAIKKDSSKLT